MSEDAQPAEKAGEEKAAAAKPEAKPVQAKPAGPLPKLEVKHLWVTYLTANGEKVPAVKDVSFTIEDKPGCGEIVVFLGPSGCGKSTILKCVAGLREPTKGEVIAQGVKVEGTSRDRGMVFQQYTSFEWLTVSGNVEYGLKLAGVPKAEREKRVTKVLAQVGLDQFARAYPKELSGGMKQRVAIARTLVNDPKLVLMDEPFGALDPQTRWSMQSLLLDISKEADNTILFVTHDVAEAVYLADTIYVLSHRPATVLHQMKLPAWKDRGLDLKQSPEFRDLENQLLDLLHGQEGGLVIG